MGREDDGEVETRERRSVQEEGWERMDGWMDGSRVRVWFITSLVVALGSDPLFSAYHFNFGSVPDPLKVTTAPFSN